MPDQELISKFEESTAKCRAMDGSLAERLAAYAADVRSFAPAFADIVEAMVARLNDSGTGLAAPKVGEAMPPFVLPAQDGQLVALDALIEKGPVVVAFHRGQWCPYCRINADALAVLEREIAPLGAQIVLVTPNLAEFNDDLRAGSGGSFPVVSDLDNGYALQLDLAFRVPDEKRQAMSSSGFDIAPFQGSEAWMLPVPATFVVGRDGRIKARFIDPDYRRRMAIEDILAALKDE